jgi:hypothetical protein
MVQLWEMTVGALLGGRGEVGGLGSSTAASSSMEGRQHDEGLLSWLSQIIQSISNLLGISPFSPSVPLPPPPHPLSLSLPPLPTSSLVDWLLHRLTLGVALVGSASFVSFLLSFSLLPIFSVFNSYHIPAFARLGRSARGRGARGGGGMRGGSDGVGIGAIVMVIIVGTGLIRSVSIHPIRSSFLSLPLSLPLSLSLSLSLSLPLLPFTPRKPTFILSEKLPLPPLHQNVRFPLPRPPNPLGPPPPPSRNGHPRSDALGRGARRPAHPRQTERGRPRCRR